MGKKKEFVIEYDFQSSPQLLFQYLSTPSGLSEWFSDEDELEEAKLLWDSLVSDLKQVLGST